MKTADTQALTRNSRLTLFNLIPEKLQVKNKSKKIPDKMIIRDFTQQLKKLPQTENTGVLTSRL
ncbi:hypothetical protein [Rubinisphaera italica]|uniref:Uncharacterized protein n=1 Tax=Rubinisphaera italica TaxID=2527969 RepID=A0A5C5XGB4_9PLAN|nr:hypothetical protein [Rubinisphaera italica]TWT61824.1 hypothetical protein Pan54_25610 [Rubinisphaera italica]